MLRSLFNAGMALSGTFGALILAANVAGHFNNKGGALLDTSVKEINGDSTVVKSEFNATGFPFYVNLSNKEKTWNVSKKVACIKEDDLTFYTVVPISSSKKTCQPFSESDPKEIKEAEEIYNKFYSTESAKQYPWL